MFCSAIVLLTFFVFSQTVNVEAKGKKEKKITRSAHKKADKKKSAQKKQSSSKRNSIAASSKQSELTSIKKDIEQAKKKVGQLEKQEKVALKKLSEAEEQKTIVQQKVGKLVGEVEKLKDTLETIRKTETSLKDRLSKVQSSYSRIAKKYLALLHKYAPDVQISPDILPGTIVNNSSGIVSRLPSYMKQMHKKMSNQILEIQNLQGALTAQQQLIAQNSNQQERILREKESEQNRIQSLVSNKRKELESVRASKEMMLNEIAKKEKSAKQVSGLISGLINNERLKKNSQQSKQSAAEQRNSKQDQSSSSVNVGTVKQQNFNVQKDESERKVAVQNANKESNRTDNTTVLNVPGTTGQFSGAFRWPSNGKRILRGFGQYRNSVTNTVMENPGLDIACSVGSSAYCAAPGTVSLVHWLPGYNSMVIVDHGNSYRSVYANLSSTNVRKGQTIGAGSIIGRTTESVDGEFLHFEIWKGKQRLNPLSYIH